MPYKNPEDKKAERLRWRTSNQEAHREISRRAQRRYREKNKEKLAEYNKQYKKANRHRATASEMRRKARLLEASPAWLTPEDKKLMERMYEMAAELTWRTKVPHHVDHIVPLRSHLVCGLHVPSNLQVLTDEDNGRKSNRLEEPRVH